MGKRITKYRLELVKESSNVYKVDNSVNSADIAYSYIEQIFNLSKQAEEVMVLLVMDSKNKITGAFEVSRGTINMGLVHPREIFKRVMLLNGASFLIAHNHPSGNSTPSNEDIAMTKRIKSCGELMGMELLDHLIIGDNTYTSITHYL